MKKENGTKIKLLKLLEILQSESDEDNSLSTTEIIEKLVENGIACDRNTVYRDINKLNESGYEILCDKEIGQPNRYRFVDKGDGKLNFKAEVQISPTFIVWCLSFGNKLKVIAPEKVKERLSSYTEQLYNLYKD